MKDTDCIAEEDPNPPLGRYEKYPIKDCALLMTSADDFFGRLSRRYPTIGLGWSIISAFMTRAWCLPVDAGIPMAGRRLTRRHICRKHMNLAEISTQDKRCF